MSNNLTILKGRKRDQHGQVILDEEGIFNLLYKGETLLSDIPVEVSNDVSLHNKWVKTFDRTDELPEYTPLEISVKQFDEDNQNHWLFPEEFQNLNILEYLLSKCETQEEMDRVNLEYALFEDREMIMVLRLLVYLVEFMRAENIVWGVGRGSACASFCLYLIGIHKVNSLKYNLDIVEFLK